MARMYGAYLFKQKDPAIDILRTLVEKHFGHRVKDEDLQEIKKSGGPTARAMRGWFWGETQRPQSATLEAAGRAIGYRRTWVRMNGNGRTT